MTLYEDYQATMAATKAAAEKQDTVLARLIFAGLFLIVAATIANSVMLCVLLLR